MHRRSAGPTFRRRGTLLVVTAALLGSAFGVVAYSVDGSYISAVREELQQLANTVAVQLVASTQDPGGLPQPVAAPESGDANRRGTGRSRSAASLIHEA